MSQLFRVGDRVRVVRGSYAGKGIVTKVDERMRRYCLDGTPGTFEEESLVLVEAVAPRYFVLMALLDVHDAYFDCDERVVYKCVFKEYNQNVTTDDKEHWGERFRAILPHTSKWLHVLKEMRSEKEKLGGSSTGTYTAEELAQVSASYLYDIMLRGISYYNTDTEVHFEEVEMFE
jgi:hypothetical protein